MDNAQINALVAEQVMGWTREQTGIGEHWRDTGGKVVHPILWADESTYLGHRWHPTSDIAQAWQVVERMYSLGYPAEIKRRPYRRTWECQFGGLVNAEAPTAPLAICLAALRALGVEVE